MSLHRTALSRLPLVLAAVALTATSACATTDDTSTPATSNAAATTEGSPATEVRLGYFANVTHAGPVYGVGSGTYAKALGDTTLKTQVFNAGPAAVEALFAGSLDASYLGPSPAINAFVKSKGEAVRIVAGATSGGASLVVAPEITSAQQLKGKIIASPADGRHPGRRAAHLAGRPGAQDRRPRRR